MTGAAMAPAASWCARIQCGEHGPGRLEWRGPDMLSIGYDGDGGTDDVMALGAPTATGRGAPDAACRSDGPVAERDPACRSAGGAAEPAGRDELVRALRSRVARNVAGGHGMGGR